MIIIPVNFLAFHMITCSRLDLVLSENGTGEFHQQVGNLRLTEPNGIKDWEL